MAGSRLPNFGTIFSRTTGLLETGGIKEVPIWYNVYKKYPPIREPDRSRSPAPQTPVLEIVYKEDFDRAKKSKSKDMRNYLEETNRKEIKVTDLVT